MSTEVNVKDDGEYKLIQKIQYTSILHKEVAYNLFIPISKVSANSIIYKEFRENNNSRTTITEFGTVETRNRLLTEKHRDIISAIIQIGTITALPNAGMRVMFREIDVLKKLKMGERNHARLRESIKQIYDTNYYITIEGFTKGLRILDTHEYIDNKKITGISFTKEYVAMHKDDFSVNLRHFHEKIAEIKYATIPSIVHYIITQNKTADEKEFLLEKVLQSIGFPINSPKAYRKIKENLKDYKETLYKDYNIRYDNKSKKLFYAKLDTTLVIDRIESSEEDLQQFIQREFRYKDEKYVIKEIYQKEDYLWCVKTDVVELDFNYFLADFIFFLENTTSDNKVQGSLF